MARTKLTSRQSAEARARNIVRSTAAAYAKRHNWSSARRAQHINGALGADVTLDVSDSSLSMPAAAALSGLGGGVTYATALTDGVATLAAVIAESDGISSIERRRMHGRQCSAVQCRAALTAWCTMHCAQCAPACTRVYTVCNCVARFVHARCDSDCRDACTDCISMHSCALLHVAQPTRGGPSVHFVRI